MLTGCSTSTTTDNKTAETQEKEPPVTSVNDEDYELEETVILSRHNVRAPLSEKGSDLYKLTPHKWIEWSSDAGELSSLGGNLETLMGQYFRKYLVENNLMEENEEPNDNDDSIRFYSNSMQRTIATAQYFTSGFLPISNIDVEYHNEIDTMDPVFNPQLTFLNEKFKKKALEEIDELGGKEGLQGIGKNLEKEYKLLADVLDLKDSEKAEEEDFTEFSTDDLEIELELKEEPSMTGSLGLATTAADALVLQYYEEPDEEKAAFGNELSKKQWEDIAHIKDVYGDVLFTAPSIAKNIANPLLKEIKSELTNDSRKFSYLSGHDSNIASVLSALDFESYELPESIEKVTPIGTKVVMEKWQNNSDETFITFKMVYLSTDQLRDLQPIDLDNPPMVYDLSLNDINKNDDGMYTYDDVIAKFDKSIDAYDALKGDN
ncbi:histidine-type phosphatase [Tetragenococcus halophilus]|uniref:histidine-type phosphatase n=1 Tax=Tetragenococcus halophilus TaxID=51669 RepID=UPI0009EEA463